jgi:hypothetical protein
LDYLCLITPDIAPVPFYIELSLDTKLYLIVSVSANISFVFSARKQRQKGLLLLRRGGEELLGGFGMGPCWLLVMLLGSAQAGAWA